MAYRLVFDIGSKNAKCAIGNDNDEIVALESFRPAVTISEDGFCRSYDESMFWNNILALTKQTFASSGIDPEQVKYVTCSSIRPSCVFVDKYNNPIYVGSSFDIRGINTADIIIPKFEALVGKSFSQITGHFPGLMYPPARYAWFRENEPINAARITKYLPMDSWILSKLGAEEHANIASAAESGFYDIAKKDWNYEWANVLDLPDDFFPPVIQSGEIVGDVSSEVCESMGLSRNVEIVSGIPDTQAALIGAGCVNELDAGIVVGSTMPVQMIKHDMFLDTQEHTWTTMINLKHVIDSYVIEANSSITGQIVAWLAGLLYDDDGQFRNDFYARLDAEYAAIDAEEASTSMDLQHVLAFLGPDYLAAAQTTIVPGIFIFPTPGTVDETPISRKQFIVAMFENIQFAAFKNLQFLQSLTGSLMRDCYLLGGVTRNATFCQRFADLANINVRTTVEKEATISGLLLCCSVAAGDITTTSDLIDRIASRNGTNDIHPRQERITAMHRNYERWNEMREKIKNL
ncbi:MAG TPA: FGGY-family carbohydrate kinase [Candidatus Lokiarchaeia archaeon]|nr:FGGY-family carbohydrate kinase [Candidatus Lokiarchaeia archaeon]